MSYDLYANLETLIYNKRDAEKLVSYASIPTYSVPLHKFKAGRSQSESGFTQEID